jgi:hypothetical protein
MVIQQAIGNGCFFIRLSDRIGEREDGYYLYPNVRECEDYLLKVQSIYPLLHKIGNKKYLFYVDIIRLNLCFKTYEGEPYRDKYGKWHRTDF